MSITWRGWSPTTSTSRWCSGSLAHGRHEQAGEPIRRLSCKPHRLAQSLPDHLHHHPSRRVSSLLVSMDIRHGYHRDVYGYNLQNARTRRLKPLFLHRHETEPDVLTLVLNALHCTAGAKVNCGAVDQINLHISPHRRYQSWYCCYSQGFKAEQNILPWSVSIVVGSPVCVGPGESQWSVVSRCG